MDNRVFDKTKLPGRHVTKGTSRAPHRSYLCVVNENLSKVVWNPEQDVIWSAAKPITAMGGVEGRFSGAMCGFCVGHAELEAVVDGPFELVRDGAIIETDAIKETINLQVGDAELEKRKKDWRPRKTNFGSGALWRYARMAVPANGRGDTPGRVE